MCGIAGVLRAGHRAGEAELGNIARRMADALRHRGPDGSGLWVDPEAGVAFGHRRLAIIDLSREGHQPMLSASGRFVIIFNGEIYNFRGLRRELEELGHRFRGHSDTEVLLGAIDQWGLGATLPKIAGMFAFALWDRELRSAHLVSDRLGKKPLYFGWIGPSLVFASELKALLQHPNFAVEVDRGALTLLLRHGCVPSPYSICRGILKLPPATHLSLPWADPNAAREADLRQRFRPYWSLAEVAERGIAEPFSLGPEAAVDRLDDLLGQVVAERMISDVPLGALLSGGIDSSTVVASMQKQSARPIKTFSIGFHEASYDEARDAKRVARHLGTDHTELYVTPDQAQAVIPRLPEIYDEPFADRSQIPTFLVARLARQAVTVALSGDGGDEIFGGYNRHFYAPWLWRRLERWPSFIRQGAADVLTSIPPHGWDKLAAQAYRFLPRSRQQPMPGYRIHKLADLFTVDGPEALYQRLTSHWTNPAALVIGGFEPSTHLTHWSQAPEGLDFTETMMYLDAVSYLPDDVLVKVDRASMAVSLEIRAPLLDHRLVEFAWRLPTAMKVRERQGKWVLRQLLDRYVPRELIDRPKQGFDVPLEAWLRGPLRDWAEAMLEPRRLREEGFFDANRVGQIWAEHLSGARNLDFCLWAVLMFQAWREYWLAGSAHTADVRCRPPMRTESSPALYGASNCSAAAELGSALQLAPSCSLS
jgi:asparagine synthase (glutamine-hydrolysing)